MAVVGPFYQTVCLSIKKDAHLSRRVHQLQANCQQQRALPIPISCKVLSRTLRLGSGDRSRWHARYAGSSSVAPVLISIRKHAQSDGRRNKIPCQSKNENQFLKYPPLVKWAAQSTMMPLLTHLISRLYLYARAVVGLSYQSLCWSTRKAVLGSDNHLDSKR